MHTWQATTKKIFSNKTCMKIFRMLHKVFGVKLWGKFKRNLHSLFNSIQMLNDWEYLLGSSNTHTHIHRHVRKQNKHIRVPSITLTLTHTHTNTSADKQTDENQPAKWCTRSYKTFKLIKKKNRNPKRKRHPTAILEMVMGKKKRNTKFTSTVFYSVWFAIDAIYVSHIWQQYWTVEHCSNNVEEEKIHPFLCESKTFRNTFSKTNSTRDRANRKIY